MDGSKCILQVRGVRPFLSSKYDIEKHPNYKYLADADPSKNFDIADFVKVYKDNKAKLLAGLNKKNTKHVVIEINEDEDIANAADANTAIPAPVNNPEPEPTEITLPAPPTETAPDPDENQDNKIDNYDNKEDEDDSDDFDPDDTELV